MSMNSDLSNSPLDVVIFCGGRGTRLSERTHEMPKPLIELGEYPILWHIMKIYSYHTMGRFILTLGYKGEMIANYFLYQYPLAQTFSYSLNNPEQPPARDEWNLSFVQTGLESKTS
jgi:glucose-1-phosphate cytidylyltransferase